MLSLLPLADMSLHGCVVASDDDHTVMHEGVTGVARAQPGGGSAGEAPSGSGT